MDRQAFSRMSYGLYVVGVQGEERLAGCVVDAVMQTTTEPPTLAYAAMKKNYTTSLLLPDTRFTISVLARNVDPFIVSDFGYQSARTAEKWAHVEHEMWNELPIVSHQSAYLFAQVTEVKELSSHMLIFADIIDAKIGDDAPIIYSDYLENKKAEATAKFMAFKANLAK